MCLFFLSTSLIYLTHIIAKDVTALHLAAAGGHEAVCRLLLEQPGIDATAKDINVSANYSGIAVLQLWRSSDNDYYSCLFRYLSLTFFSCNLLAGQNIAAIRRSLGL
jgi:ankyrin repeat protein